MTGQKEEILFSEDESRLVVFPIKHNDIWEFYKKHLAVFWTTEEIQLQDDLDDWVKLTPDEQHFIKNVLAFFAASDGIVNMNLEQRFCNDVQILEAKIFYAFQTAMENIHAETYSLLIDTYIKNKNEKNRLLNAVDTIPAVQKKARWAMEWIGSDATYAHRLVAFACVEAIFFSGSFCSIFWLKKRGLMRGLCFSNELISRDEGIHCDFACMLYAKYIANKLSQDTINEIVMDAVAIETEFICESLPCRLIGMNSDLMTQYIQFVADRLITQLGYEKVWHVENPFDFMEQISVERKTNFFENKVSEYSRAGVCVDAADQTFDLCAEF